MRNDKDFIIGLNVLGMTLATLLKCYGLVDSDNPEDMYFLNIFKDALIYHLMQFHINTNQVYDFLTQLIYSQHCDHPNGSINLVALWLYTIVVILTKQKFSVGCVMELALQLTHNSRLSIGYQTVTDAHKNKGLKGSNSLL